MFVTDITMNRKPGGNGAHSDTAATPDELVKIVSVLDGTDGGWAQLSGAGKFMAVNAVEGGFTVSVTELQEPRKKYGLGKVPTSKMVDAVRAFAEDGRMHQGLVWKPEAMRPARKAS